MKNMKDTDKNDFIVAQALLKDLEKYAKEQCFTKDIQYSIYREKYGYRIKIEKDEEHILQSYLERTDE